MNAKEAISITKQQISQPRPVAQLKTLKPVVSEEASVDEIRENANKNNNLNMQMLIETLTKLENRLGPRTQSPMEETVKAMVGLHSTLVNVINNSKSVQEFREQWELVLKMFKEHEKGGFGQHRLYRAVAYWPKSQDEYMHFQSLMNLIYVTNHMDRAVWAKNINFNAIGKAPITDAGRSRLMSYYL